MPINYPSIRALTPQEAGGFGGIDLAGSIQSGLENANRIQDLRNAPIRQKLLQAELESIPYKQKLLQAKAQAALRPKPIAGKISQLEQLRDRFAPGSEQYQLYDTALRNALAGQQGITVFDPQGNPMVQIGGSAGAKGNGAGTIYQSPTGEQYQTPTKAVQTNLQQRIVGQKIVEPYIQNMIKTLPQFQSGWTKGLAGAEGIANRWLRTNFDLPSQLQEGMASKGLAAEGMLREFGLNATGKNLERMEAILTPGKDESDEGYRNRATRQAIQFLQTTKESQELSRSGIPVKENNEPMQQIKTKLSAKNTGGKLPLDKRNTPNASHGITPESIQKERQMDIATAKQFNTTPEKVLIARSQGVKTANQFREWLRSNP